MVFRQTIGLGNGDIKFSKIDICGNIFLEKIMGLGYKKKGSLRTKSKARKYVHGIFRTKIHFFSKIIILTSLNVDSKIE